MKFLVLILVVTGITVLLLQSKYISSAIVFVLLQEFGAGNPARKQNLVLQLQTPRRVHDTIKSGLKLAGGFLSDGFQIKNALLGEFNDLTALTAGAAQKLATMAAYGPAPARALPPASTAPSRRSSHRS